jgi:16S rRNA (guanine966-N2)-methyltransferase
MFDLVGVEVQRASVLDLFAGLGTVGLEALSRGADRTVFVERDPRLCRLLKENLKGARCSERSEIMCLDAVHATAALRERGDSFTLVFVDPPYGFRVAEQVLRCLSESAVLAPGALVAVEHGRREELSEQTTLRLTWRRRLGYTVLTGYRYNPQAASRRSTE